MFNLTEMWIFRCKNAVVVVELLPQLLHMKVSFSSCACYGRQSNKCKIILAIRTTQIFMTHTKAIFKKNS